MVNTQLVQDLNDLLGEIDAGWCAYQSMNSRRTHVTQGIGGCVGEAMERMLDRTHIRPGQFGKRHNSMVIALGFTRWCRYTEKTAADPNAMFEWNDQQRDPDAIKRRIKDALEQASR
jgi:hypothetical protein